MAMGSLDREEDERARKTAVGAAGPLRPGHPDLRQKRGKRPVFSYQRRLPDRARDGHFPRAPRSRVRGAAKTSGTRQGFIILG